MKEVYDIQDTIQTFQQDFDQVTLFIQVSALICIKKANSESKFVISIKDPDEPFEFM